MSKTIRERKDEQPEKKKRRSARRAVKQALALVDLDVEQVDVQETLDRIAYHEPRRER